MISVWTRHLEDPQAKERFEQELFHSNVVPRFLDLLDGLERELEVAERNISAYDNPNWAYRQAHCNGNRQMIAKIKTLFDFDQKETNDRRLTRPKPRGAPSGT